MNTKAITKTTITRDGCGRKIRVEERYEQGDDVTIITTTITRDEMGRKAAVVVTEERN